MTKVTGTEPANGQTQTTLFSRWTVTIAQGRQSILIATPDASCAGGGPSQKATVPHPNVGGLPTHAILQRRLGHQQEHGRWPVLSNSEAQLSIAATGLPKGVDTIWWTGGG